MIEVSIHIIPHGNRKEVFQAGKIAIANIGGDGSFCNYAYCIFESSPLIGDPYMASGIIRGYYRLAPCMDILLAVLEAFKSKNSFSPEGEYERSVIEYLEDTIKKAD